MAGRCHDLCHDDYTVGCVKLAAAQEMLDEKHGDLVTGGDDIIYTLGRIGGHNIVIVCIPEGQMGTNPAAAAATRMQSAFPSIRFRLMVGIGGEVPSTKPDIRLGDVVYDFGKTTPGGFKRTGFLNAPAKILQIAVSHLKAKHMRGESQLSEYILELAHLPTFTRDHAGPDERILRRPVRDQLGPEIHYGTIASGNQVMRDAAERDRVSAYLSGVLCFEMEAAGLMNEFPCLVIWGICDYSDSHKSKAWQPYAAGVAAAYTKELLSVMPPLESSIGAKRFFTVPFQRDDKFFGREAIMAEMHNKFQSTALRNHLRVALVGIGGIGKSQIAIEYAYIARERNPELSVFWVYAGNAARYEQAYRDLANELDLPGRDDPTVDIFKIVPHWLSDNTNGQWLMILDNADNEDLFTQEIEVGMKPNSPNASVRAPLITSIPQTATGSVIITSRNSTAARNLLGIHDNIIPIDVMDGASALDLLQTKVTLDEQSLIDARRLLQDLEYIPLAIIQAGSYIQENEANLATLLGSMAIQDSRRDYSSQHVVTATWQISFQQIQASSPMSSDLLALMSMFDRQGIPEYLLQQNMTQLQLEDAIHPLISHSLIKESGIQQHSFEIHRLSEKSAEIIAAAFPSGDFDTWPECRNLQPHAKEIMRQATENNISSIVNRNTKVRWHQRLKRKVMSRPRDKLPTDSHGSLMWATIGNNAGRYLYFQGKYQEAEAIHRHGLAGLEKVLGLDHPDTLISVNNLGSVLESQGNYKEAEGMYRRALRAHKKILGLDHPYTLLSADHLASVLESQGKYDEANTIRQEAKSRTSY
ncbi:hypothetical protein BDV38DRAFT_273463 [Aspergillus pseudotamarii]|uniref:Nucleoside phosphorylase domain-containing protein n=1 Tax=Aspergillus pseudotamarii TaxID=132259 RepID=A0A5N6SIU4_ASPPS|nr:uncharacterized protein BDV38DRAFT_273463 [Aspergillus pseudotamarii]KAE8134606.1 hypothetical protein BDV38DRAFT_273463 [Aspergillus pseudotamarii]